MRYLILFQLAYRPATWTFQLLSPAGPMTNYAPSGKAQPYLPHVTCRVLRSVHAKFHVDWTKTVGARGIQTNKQTNRQSYFNYID